MENIFYTLVFFFLIVAYIIIELISAREKKNKWGLIESTEYMKYSNFYGGPTKQEDEKTFKEKIDKIYNLITKEKCDDIKLIAKESKCSYNECIIKINYLKRNNLISQDYYVDHINGYIKKCDDKDLALIKKYSAFLYRQKLQIRDIAVKLPHITSKTINKGIEEVRRDIKYLIEKDLVEGVIYNEVDDVLIYYDDKKRGKDLINKKCPNCGAIVELQRGGKERCEYCNSIIDGDENRIITKKDNK